MNNLTEISEYADIAKYRFHTPGHSGKGGIMPELTPQRDVTEVYGIDLYSSKSTKGEAGLCDIYGAECAAISPQGATLGIFASVLCCIRRGVKRFLVERSVHVSALNALALLGGDFSFWEGENIPDGYGCLLVTSPDYFGRIKNLSILAAKCREKGMLFIVDSAHGAHFPFTAHAHLGAYTVRPDIAVYSLHKTLPCLTGAALVCSYGSFEYREIISAMKLFASTSPSYLISASAEALCDKRDEIRQGFDNMLECISTVRKALSQNAVYCDDTDDPYRIVLTSGKYGKMYDLTSLAPYLEKQGVFTEHIESDRAIFIPGISLERAAFDALILGVKEFTEKERPRNINTSGVKLPEIIQRVSPASALSMPNERVNIDLARGRLAAETVYACPPGFALALPGCVITEEIVRLCKNYDINEIFVCL